MILSRPYKRKQFEPYTWFAWYPVWAFDTLAKSFVETKIEELVFVWLEKVVVHPGSIVKKRYFLVNPRKRKE